MDSERSPRAKRIIRDYYQNREAIALQRAHELVTELYLSSGKKRERHWEHLITHLKALGFPQSQIDHLRSADNPELVARALKRVGS